MSRKYYSHSNNMLWELVYIIKYIIAAAAPLPISVDTAATRPIGILLP